MLFLIGFAASMVSWWHVRRIHVPDRSPIAPAPSAAPARWAGRCAIRGSARFLVAVGALQLALGMIAPLLPLYWVRQLGATDGQISIVMTVFPARWCSGR